MNLKIYFNKITVPWHPFGYVFLIANPLYLMFWFDKFCLYVCRYSPNRLPLSHTLSLLDLLNSRRLTYKQEQSVQCLLSRLIPLLTSSQQQVCGARLDRRISLSCVLVCLTAHMWATVFLLGYLAHNENLKTDLQSVGQIF